MPQLTTPSSATTSCWVAPRLFLSRMLVAFVFFVLLGTTALPQTYRAFNPRAQDNPYGLPDFDEITAGPYAYCRWGNYFGTPDTLLNVTFRKHTQGPFNYRNKDLFISTSLVNFDRVALPDVSPAATKAIWTVPATDQDAGSVRYLSQTGTLPNHWFRKLHFPTSLKVYPELADQKLSAEDKKLIILVHGWNPDSYDDAYRDEFQNLVTAIYTQIHNHPDWKLLLYHWEQDSDTGPKLTSPLVGGIINGIEACEIGNQHGLHLGKLLNDTCPGLEKVHFIAHSAGSWTARSAAKYLIKNTSDQVQIKIQVTLLDPAIPSEIKSEAIAEHSSFIIDDSNLSLGRMNEMVDFPGAGSVWLAENYFSVDSGLATAFGTQSVFSWGHNSKQAEVGISAEGNTNNQFLSSGYAGHSGPIGFYADTVSSYAGTALVQPAEIGSFDLNSVGWSQSMFKNEPYFTIQPVEISTGQSQVSTIPSTTITFHAEATTRLNASVTYAWHKVGQSGLIGSGSDLILSNVSKADEGSYYCIATQAGLTETSVQATLSIVGGPATVVQPPQPVAVVAGISATFSVIAGGASPLSYQWLRGEVDIPGANAATYTIPTVALIDNGAAFKVRVTNSVNSVTSAVGTLTVTNGVFAIPDDYGNSSTQATALTLGTAKTGFISSSTDVDWFKVDVSTPGTVTLNLSVPAGKDYDLELFGPDAGYIKGSYGDTGMAESISFSAPNIGTYYLRVCGYPVGNGSYSANESYSLNVGSATQDIDLGQWTWRNPMPQGYALYGIASNGVQLVAVGQGGSIASSLNGQDWTVCRSGTLQDLYGVTWDGRQFVAVGSSGVIVTSFDGVAWTTRPLGTNSVLNSVAAGNGQIVAIGDDNHFYTSEDGVSWTSHTWQTTASWRVIWSGAMFVVVGYGGQILTSSDGVTWVVRESGCPSLWGVAWSGSKFVALGGDGTGYGQVVTSPDGITWTLSDQWLPEVMNSVIWTGTRFLAVGLNGNAMSSEDGLVWSILNTGTTGVLWDVVMDKGRFVVVADGGAVLTSQNGSDWNGEGSDARENLTDVCWNGSQFVSVGETGRILLSQDGVVWSVPNSVASTANFSAVTWGVDRFVAVGSGGAIVTSNDGLDWTIRDTGATGADLKSVVWGGEQFVSAGASGAILTSPDGVSWTSRDSGTTGSFYGITWSGSQYVAVGDGVFTSADGRLWTKQQSGALRSFTGVLKDVAWNGKRFVAIGGGMLGSLDGISWTRLKGPGGGCIAWIGDQFVVFSGSTVYSSGDGITWASQSMGYAGGIAAAAFGDRICVTVGGKGAILTCDFLTPTIPRITTQPNSHFVVTGIPITLNVVANGAGTLRYQWKKDDIDIPGASNLSLTLSSAQLSEAGQYSVVVSNDLGSTRSTNATISVLSNAPGTVAVIGDNTYGQANVPVGLSGVTAISAGGSHVMALKSDGTVVAWGNNHSSQTDVRSGLTGVKAISAGFNYSLALKSDGTLVQWGGENGQGMPPEGLTGIVAIASSTASLSNNTGNSLALTNAGYVYAWGGTAAWEVPVDLKNVSAISAGGKAGAGGYSYGVAAKTDGTVVTWAWPTSGLSAVTSGLKPVPAGLSGVVGLAGGGQVAALRSDNTVVSWGLFSGIENNATDGLSGVISVEGTFALRSDGTLVDWSYSDDTYLPEGLKDVKAIARGANNLVLLFKSGPGVAPGVTTQPASKDVSVGGTVTFSTSASGDPTPSYQWQVSMDGGGSWSNLVDGSSYSGVSTAALNIAGTSVAMSGYEFRCVVSNGVSPNATSNAVTLTVQKFEQTIAFGQLAGKSYGDAPFAISATASSGLPVTFSIVSGPATVSGNVITLTGAGTVVVRSSQSGDSTFNAAPSVDRSFLIAKAVPLLTWPNPAAVVYGTALNGTQLNATSGGVPGSFAYSPAAGTVLNAGSQSLGVIFTPTDTANYSSVTKSVSLTVNKALLTVIADNKSKLQGTVNPILTMSFSGFVNGDSASSLATQPTVSTTAAQASLVGSYPITVAGGISSNYSFNYISGSLNVNSPGAPSFTLQPASQTASVGSAVTFTASASDSPTYQWQKDNVNIIGAVGNTYIIASVVTGDAGNYSVIATNSSGSVTSNIATLTVNKILGTVTLGNLLATYDGLPHAAPILGTTPIGLTVALTYNGSATAPTNAGSYAVVATINDPTYTGTTSGILNITKANPVITWAAPSPIASGTPLSPTQLNATANVGGTFIYSPASGAVLGVGDHTLTAAFTPADQTNYANTGLAQRTLTVQQGNGGLIPIGFDVQGYLARYPDVAAIYGTDLYGAWIYYRDYGVYQGQIYDELFRVEEYLTLYPELFAIFGTNLSGALMHWLNEGSIEGRLGRIPQIFSAQGYFDRNPDVAAAVGGNPLLAWQHYWAYGIYEGRAYDDELYVFEYLAVNADLTAAFVNDWRAAALHWMRYGRTEGRLGRVPLLFEVSEYLNRYPDVGAAWGTYPTTVFLHFWLYGINEGKTFDNAFRVDEYLALNPDLATVFGTDRRGAFKHWVRYGQAEGRLGRNP